MLLTAMLIDALHATLEDAEIALSRVTMDLWNFIIEILTGTLVSCAMRWKMLARTAIDVAFVGYQDSFMRYIGANNRHHRFGCHIINNHRAGIVELWLLSSPT